MLKPITLAACLSVAAFSAHADGAVKQGPALTAEEVRRELGGVYLEGENSVTYYKWAECIQKDGATVYKIEGVELRGRLTVGDDGRACFAYENDDFQDKSCFRVTRSDAGYIFWGGGGEVFFANSVKRNVRSCELYSAPTS